MKRPGLFVTVDGPGAVGKSTVTGLLVERLTADGLPVHGTIEPSRAPAGELARHGTHTYRGLALAHLVAADRYHHLETEIRPALDAGQIVVCDRYLASSLVLQRLDGVDVATILKINEEVDPPDLAIILNAEESVIQARLRGRGAHSRFEEDPDNIRAEIALYRETARLLRGNGIDVLLVDCSHITPKQVAEKLYHPIVALWQRRARRAAG